MNVTRDNEIEAIAIDQNDYTEDIVERFGMKDCKPLSHQERDRNVRSTNRRILCWTNMASGGTSQS